MDELTNTFSEASKKFKHNIKESGIFSPRDGVKNPCEIYIQGCYIQVTVSMIPLNETMKEESVGHELKNKQNSALMVMHPCLPCH